MKRAGQEYEAIYNKQGFDAQQLRPIIEAQMLI
jgi:hypothetical protein